MKIVFCDICHAIGADSYTYKLSSGVYDYIEKVPNYDVDLCPNCVVDLYKELITQLQISNLNLKSGLIHISNHVDSIKTLIQCPATDVSTSPPPMK